MTALLGLEASLILSLPPFGQIPARHTIFAAAVASLVLAVASTAAFACDWHPVDGAYEGSARDPQLRYPYAAFPRLSLVAAVAIYLLGIFWIGVYVLIRHGTETPSLQRGEPRALAVVAGIVLVHFLLLALTLLALVWVFDPTPKVGLTAVSRFVRSSPRARRAVASGVVAVLFIVDCLFVYRAWGAYASTAASGIDALHGWWRVSTLPFGTGQERWRRVRLVLSSVSSMWIPFLLVTLPSTVLRRPGRTPRAGTLATSFLQGRFWLVALFVDSSATALYAIPLGLALGLTFVADWIGITTPQNFSGYTAFSAWFAATMVWAIPFARGLLFIDESCARAYATSLTREIQRLTDHTLILGYGPIAQRFLHDVNAGNLLRYSSRRDHHEGARNILLPNGRLGKLLTRVAIVDNDTARDAVVTQSGTRISMVKLATSRVATPDEELVECFVPVVVGDVGERLPELAGFANAAFVVCAMPPTSAREPSQVVLAHLVDLAHRRKKYIPAILVTYSSDIAPHLVSTIVDHRLPAHYILPEHLEGLSAADVAHAAFEKLRARDDERRTPGRAPNAEGAVQLTQAPPPLMIVCGREDRARQVIDGFLKHLTTEKMATLSPVDDPTVVLMTGRAGTGQPPSSRSQHLERWLYRRGLLASGFSFSERYIARLVTRHTCHANRVFADSRSIFVPIIAEPFESEDLWMKVLTSLEPNIIVFSDPDPDAELSAIRAAVTCISRSASKATPPSKLPILVVSGESGRRNVTRQFENVLVYYSSLWSRGGSERFPAPEMAASSGYHEGYKGDFLVDVINDPVERMIGLFRAYDVYANGHQSGMAARLPVELEFCAPDRPGAIATTLAALSGLDLESEFAGDRPTLGNAKIVLRADGTIALRGFAYLDDRKPSTSGTARFARLALTPGQRANDVRRIVSSLLKNNPTAWRHDRTATALRTFRETGLEADLNDAKTLFSALNVGFQQQLESCCGMPGCPVEAVQKIVKAITPTVVDEMIEDAAKRTRHAEALVDHFMADEYHGSEPLDHDLPFAAVSAIIEDGAGHLAVAMNDLQLRTTASKPYIDGWAFDPTYVSAYECHDERFAVFSCYGALMKRAAGGAARRGPTGSSPSPIRNVTINPITRAAKWQLYAECLGRHLTRDGKRFAVIHTPRKDASA